MFNMTYFCYMYYAKKGHLFSKDHLDSSHFKCFTVFNKNGWLTFHQDFIQKLGFLDNKYCNGIGNEKFPNWTTSEYIKKLSSYININLDKKYDTYLDLVAYFSTHQKGLPSVLMLRDPSRKLSSNSFIF